MNPPRLDIDKTRERLLSLDCTYAAEDLGRLLADAVSRDIPAHAFIDELLDSEIDGREARRRAVSLKMSLLPTGQTLENFDFAFQPAVERSRIDTLATGAWIRNAETVLLQGPPGVGKTHLSIALGTRAIELGFSVLYYRFNELMAALKADAVLPAAKLRRRRYMNMGIRPVRAADSGVAIFLRVVCGPIFSQVS